MTLKQTHVRMRKSETSEMITINIFIIIAVVMGIMVVVITVVIIVVNIIINRQRGRNTFIGWILGDFPQALS